MNISESRAKLANDASALSMVEALLMKYPDLTAEEGQEIARFLRRGAPIDVGLLSTNAEVWGKAEQFRLDNPKAFATTGKEYAVGGCTILAFVMLCFLLWNAAL